MRSVPVSTGTGSLERRNIESHARDPSMPARIKRLEVRRMAWMLSMLADRTDALEIRMRRLVSFT
jgi:hypothetical protein